MLRRILHIPNGPRRSVETGPSSLQSKRADRCDERVPYSKNLVTHLDKLSNMWTEGPSMGLWAKCAFLLYSISGRSRLSLVLVVLILLPNATDCCESTVSTSVSSAASVSGRATRTSVWGSLVASQRRTKTMVAKHYRLWLTLLASRYVIVLTTLVGATLKDGTRNQQQQQVYKRCQRLRSV
eukprot:6483697-Amphidinium_carterae.1